jgi:hypothetical protein
LLMRPSSCSAFKIFRSILSKVSNVSEKASMAQFYVAQETNSSD